MQAKFLSHAGSYMKHPVGKDCCVLPALLEHPAALPETLLSVAASRSRCKFMLVPSSQQLASP